MKDFTDHVDIVQINTEIHKDQQISIPLKLQYARDPSVFATTPKMGWPDLNLTVSNAPVLLYKFYIPNEQWHAIAPVVQLGQSSQLYIWLPNTEPGGYDNCTGHHHQYCAVVQMRHLHGLISGPNIITLIICWILKSLENCKKHLTQKGDILQSAEPLS
jgi:hypothetical protein